MKIGGIDPKSLATEEILVLPRGESQIVFKATGLPDLESFNRTCPEPTPPNKLTKDGPVPDTDDENYRTDLVGYLNLRTAYIVVHSLAPSLIEWDTVNVDNPSTLTNWETDLKEAGLNHVEINRVRQLAWEANCLDESKLEKARLNFVRGQAKQ